MRGRGGGWERERDSNPQTDRGGGGVGGVEVERKGGTERARERVGRIRKIRGQ